MRAHLECAECKKSDELYEDSHGTFCRRCGPSVPVNRMRTIWARFPEDDLPRAAGEGEV